jgi:hypothetical protein
MKGPKETYSYYEEISSQREINGDSFTQVLCDWRFSISSSSGGAWIPSISYFLIEYTFFNAAGTDAPLSSSKMILGCDWAASLFRFNLKSRAI